MPEFHKATVDNLTTEEIDELVGNGKLKLKSIGYGYETINNNITLPGGWKCKWINTQGMGNHGSLVIIPGDERTNKIYQYGLVQYARNAGLDIDIAGKWASSMISYKFELIQTLVDIYNSEGNSLYNAYMDFPDDWNHGAIGKWKGEYKGIINNNLSAHRYQSLKKLLKEFSVDFYIESTKNSISDVLSV